MAGRMLAGMLLDADMAFPAWRDPLYVDALRLRQFEAHEQTIRLRERARERRRLTVALGEPDPDPLEDPDFPGCFF